MVRLRVSNPNAALRCDLTAEGAVLHGSCGSSWTTRDERKSKGWPDVGPPENVLLLESERQQQPRFMAWEATVTLLPQQHGEQAGLYAYADENSWVKLVAEGAGSDGSAQLILASQRDGRPRIDGKLPLPACAGSLSLSLRLEVGGADGASASGAYSLCEPPGELEKTKWEPVLRGLAWLRDAELEGRPYGSLEPGDPRGRDAATAALPPGWRAALVTEQWAEGSEREVSFTALRCDSG